jgi:hypothetical protein
MAPLGETVTLRWTHSIEKTLWEEVWQSEAGGLRLVEARIRGTGAGMEPPPGARLIEGAWHYDPALPPQPSVLLTHSPHVPSYTICADGRCQAVEVWLPGLPEEALLLLQPCSDSP